MKKEDILNMPAIAYDSKCGGIEIKGFIDYDQKVLFVSNAWYGKKQAHIVKVNQTVSGRLWFRINKHGQRVYLDECLRVNV